jgi:hypothetical protein
MGVVYAAVSAEEGGTPAIALVNTGFKHDAASAASHKGMPVLRIVLETVPCESRVTEQIETGVSAAMEDIIDALTRHLTEEEKSPKPKEIEKPSRLIFKGSLEEVNQFFYRRGWTDGLPVIPPTEEAVRQMLTGTDLPPDYLVGKLGPRFGKATIEKIAINAVMAGALPTYFPVLIAAVQAMLDPLSNAEGWSISAGSWAPFWIINGPVRHDLGIKNGTGALSPGNIANATIGRAMALITQNIRGVRHGVECMGTLGNPMKYSMVVAENEEDNPWEPLQVEQGFRREDSTVSLFFPNNYLLTGAQNTDDRGILNGIIYNHSGGAALSCIMLIPSHAKTLADAGWKKEDIKNFISEYARRPLYQNGRGSTLGSTELPINPQDTVAVMPNPDTIKLIVAGGAGNMIGIIKGASGGLTPGAGRGRLMTKKIETPANWRELVQMYKSIVPTYSLY